MLLQMEFTFKGMLPLNTVKRRSAACHTAQTSSFRPPCPPPFYFLKFPFLFHPASLPSLPSIFPYHPPFPSCKSTCFTYFPTSFATLSISVYYLHQNKNSWPLSVHPSTPFFSFFLSVNGLILTAIQIHFHKNLHQQAQWKGNWIIFLWDTVA